MRNLISRIWNLAPEWLFRLLGAAVFFSYIALRISDYYQYWNNPAWGFYYRLADGQVIRLQFVQILVDLTFMTIAIGYCVRGPARRRAAGFSQVVVPFVAAVWPMLPFWLMAALPWIANRVPSLAPRIAPVTAAISALFGMQ